ncbi:MAG: choice-of-anchor J domain-containing protein [Bacteroidaceae bacterium]|nr:choice-of-anchor J domain-containing protein [Bacteroidaceae bacterium]
MKRTYTILTTLLLALTVQAQTVTPTWSVSFDNKSDLDGFTIIDANGDGHMYEGILRGGWSWLSHEEVNGAASYYYDRYNAADDWLITPGINLKEGREYYLTFDANAANIYPERFEVFFGTAPTVEGMTERLIEPTVVNKGEFEGFKADINVSHAGVYYIGIHAISDKSQYILDIKNIKVEAGLLADAPAGVTDFTLTADPAGLKKTTVAFTLPTTLNNGEPLAEITMVDVLRNGVSVKTFENQQPGDAISFTDAVPEEGLYTYSVVVYNANGDGAPVLKKVFVGYDAPTPPINPHVVDKFTSIDLVWEQSLGQNGGLIKRSDMNYYIYAIDDEGNIGNRLTTVTKGKLLYNIPMDTQTGEQKLLTYAMIAGNSQGLSERVETKGFLVGKPLSYPFAEHFAAQEIENFWWVSGKGLGFENGYAGFVTTKSAAEGDKGSLLFEGFFDDDVVVLHSAKVSLEGSAHPWLSFSHKTMAGTEVDMSVVAVRPNGESVTLRNFDYRTYKAADWTNELIDLSDYQEDKYIVIEFVYNNHSDEKATMVYLDNITIGEVADYKISVGYDCPESVVAGKDFAHSVTITNLGTKPLSGYHVLATCEGKGIDETVSDELKPMESRTFTNTVNVPFEDAGKQYEIKAEVTMPEGVDVSDVQTEDVKTVKVMASDIPTVSELGGSKDDNTLTITWKSPENPSLKVLDDFESYSPFLLEGIGEWTCIDKDGGISEQLFQGYETGLEDKAYAFTTFNLSALNPGLLDTNEEFASRSGNQCLAAFFCHDGFYNYRNQDNWLVSPLLNEKSQKITLYAANYDIKAPEVFEILYSMTDTQPESFIRIGAERRVADGQWHPFTATLPTGARYFAIHHYTDADNAYMLRLDDISFTKALEVESYDIYLNGEFVENTTDCQYVVNSPSDTDGYSVAVRYTDGSVSKPLAVEVEIVDAIEGVHADRAENSAIYNVAGQRITASKRGNIIILNGKKYIK